MSVQNVPQGTPPPDYTQQTANMLSLAPPGSEGDAFSNNVTYAGGKKVGEDPDDPTAQLQKLLGNREQDSLESSTDTQQVVDVLKGLNINVQLFNQESTPEQQAQIQIDNIDPQNPTAPIVLKFVKITERAIQVGDVANVTVATKVDTNTKVSKNLSEHTQTNQSVITDTQDQSQLVSLFNNQSQVNNQTTSEDQAATKSKGRGAIAGVSSRGGGSALDSDYTSYSPNQGKSGKTATNDFTGVRSDIVSSSGVAGSSDFTTKRQKAERQKNQEQGLGSNFLGLDLKDDKKAGGSATSLEAFMTAIEDAEQAVAGSAGSQNNLSLLGSDNASVAADNTLENDLESLLNTTKTSKSATTSANTPVGSTGQTQTTANTSQAAQVASLLDETAELNPNVLAKMTTSGSSSTAGGNSAGGAGEFSEEEDVGLSVLGTIAGAGNSSANLGNQATSTAATTSAQGTTPTSATKATGAVQDSSSTSQSVSATAQKTNPWLAGNAYTAFMISYFELVNILKKMKQVDSQLQLSGMAQVFALAQQTSDAIMNAAKQRALGSIIQAVISGVSMGVTVLGTAASVMQTSKMVVEEKGKIKNGVQTGAWTPEKKDLDGNIIQESTRMSKAQAKAYNLKLTSGRWGTQTIQGYTQAFQAGSKAMDDVTQAIFDIAAAKYDAQKALLEAYSTIAQQQMETGSSSFKSDSELISNVIQGLDQIRQQLMQAITAALQKK